MSKHFVSACCGGEICQHKDCTTDASHKVGETIFLDDPFATRHELTAYLCCEHFTMIMGNATTCFPDPYDD